MKPKRKRYANDSIPKRDKAIERIRNAVLVFRAITNSRAFPATRVRSPSRTPRPPEALRKISNQITNEVPNSCHCPLTEKQRSGTTQASVANHARRFVPFFSFDTAFLFPPTAGAGLPFDFGLTFASSPPAPSTPCPSSSPASPSSSSSSETSRSEGNSSPDPSASESNSSNCHISSIHRGNGTNTAEPGPTSLPE
jgi:hypothetical protein